MAYIYKITNDINNKIYVGKTEFSIEKRFKEHCADSSKSTLEKRPLYAAMRKYGTEHFYIELLEETNQPEEREKYWIEKLGSFKNGYNATKGGDGKKYIDYDLVISTFLQTKNAKETARILGIDYTHTLHILEHYNIPRLSGQYVNANKQKNIGCFKEQKLIISFINMHEAARWLIKNNKTSAEIKNIVAHLSRACHNKRRTAYGYEWKFLDINI